MKPWKAPGPDGFPVGFYQKSWDVVCRDLCDFVRKAWHNPSILADINNIDIWLIQKVDYHKRIEQFRLICLYNTLYKDFTKVLVGRLKPHMSSLVSPCQTGFVPSR